MQTVLHNEQSAGNDKGALARNDKLVNAKNRFASDFNVLVRDAEELLKSSAAYSGESLSAARGKFQDTLDRFKTRAYDAQDFAVGRFNQAASVTQEYVQENPWKIAGAAALVGIILGILMQRR